MSVELIEFNEPVPWIVDSVDSSGRETGHWETKPALDALTKKICEYACNAFKEGADVEIIDDYNFKINDSTFTFKVDDRGGTSQFISVYYKSTYAPSSSSSITASCRAEQNMLRCYLGVIKSQSKNISVYLYSYSYGKIDLTNGSLVGEVIHTVEQNTQKKNILLGSYSAVNFPNSGELTDGTILNYSYSIYSSVKIADTGNMLTFPLFVNKSGTIQPVEVTDFFVITGKQLQKNEIYEIDGKNYIVFYNSSNLNIAELV